MREIPIEAKRLQLLMILLAIANDANGIAAILAAFQRGTSLSRNLVIFEGRLPKRPQQLWAEGSLAGSDLRNA